MANLSSPSSLIVEVIEVFGVSRTVSRRQSSPGVTSPGQQQLTRLMGVAPSGSVAGERRHRIGPVLGMYSMVVAFLGMEQAAGHQEQGGGQGRENHQESKDVRCFLKRREAAAPRGAWPVQ